MTPVATASNLRGPRAALGTWFGALSVAIICLVATALQFLPASSAPIYPLEYGVKDALWRRTASAKPESRIIVVDIDEISLQQTGPWPWSRDKLADLLEHLVSDHGARAVGLDMVLPAPADPGGDQRLKALSQLAPLVWGQVFDLIQRQNTIMSGVPAEGAQQWPGHWPLATGYLANHIGLSEARCHGQISSVPDDDGTVRRLPLVVEWQKNHHLTLSLAMLYCDAATKQTVSGFLQSNDTPYWEVPYVRQLDAFTTVPAADILQKKIDPAFFQDKWVLVGSSALGLNDSVSTPLNATVPGVMVHAQALAVWLDRLDGTEPKAWPHLSRTVAVFWTVLSLGCLAWAMLKWRAWLLLPLVAVLSTAWLGGIAPWLLQSRQALIITAPLLGYAAFLLLMPVAWWLSQRERRLLVQTFSTYVAPAVLETMLRNGLDKPLTPRHAEITVLSADMQNYTGLTAISTLQESAELTRGFLQCITEPLLRHQGTLDKYTGDGLVAFWGAPLPQADAPNRAIRAAIEMVGAVREWNLKRIAQGLPPARVRIGIDAGPALVGDLGSQFRSTYTAVGNCINNASKIQSLARNLPSDILVGQTAASAITAVPLHPVTQSSHSGSQQPDTIYAPDGVFFSLPEFVGDGVSPTGRPT